MAEKIAPRVTEDQGPKFVRIGNRTKALLHLPDAMQTKRDHNDEEHYVGLASGKTLLPGGNNVDAVYWDRIQGHRVVREWIRLRMIEVREDSETRLPEGPEIPRSLGEYTMEQSMIAIQHEDRPEVLRQWIKGETRGDVKQALQRKIEAAGGGA